MARTEVVDLLALCRVPDVSWSFLAREAQRPGGLADLLAGRSSEQSTDARDTLRSLDTASGDLSKNRSWISKTLEDLEAAGAHVTTVLDDDYPVNLRLIYNLPPFLTYRGTLRDDDALSVAVVGTRDATADGIKRATKMARALTQAGVTVLSGLARGIDTAAHEATLEAGGRTIAVMGTGIRRVYPEENRGLAERIADNGALVSQFWPDGPPTTYSFPRRNVVMSGMGQGTVVVEASATSGAKMQARIALEHGKRVFLLPSLVKEREWARRYLDKGAVEVGSADDILRLLQSPEVLQARTEQRRQLTLTLS